MMGLLWAYGCGLLALAYPVHGNVDPFGCKSCEEEVALESFTGCFNVVGVNIGSSYAHVVGYCNQTTQAIASVKLETTSTDSFVDTAFFADIQRRAEEFLATNVTGIVLTFSPYEDRWSPYPSLIPDDCEDCHKSKRAVIEMAAASAGLVVESMRENEAILNVHPLPKTLSEGHKFLLLDIGGRNASIMLAENSHDYGYGYYEVLARAYDESLGGLNFNQRTLDYLLSREYNSSLTSNWDKAEPNEQAKILQDVENAKRTLSTKATTNILLPSSQGPVHAELTRAEFETVNQELFQNLIGLIDKVLQEGNTTKEDLTAVILAGGTARIPRIQEIMKEAFGQALVPITDPEMLAARGAAIKAHEYAVYSNGCLGAYEFLTSVSIGLRITGDMLARLVPKHAYFPRSSSHVLSTLHLPYTIETNYDGLANISVDIYAGLRPMLNESIFLYALNLSHFPLDLHTGAAALQLDLQIHKCGEMNYSLTALPNGPSTSHITHLPNILDLFPRETVHEYIRRADEQTESDANFQRRTDTLFNLWWLVHELRTNATAPDTQPWGNREQLWQLGDMLVEFLKSEGDVTSEGNLKSLLEDTLKKASIIQWRKENKAHDEL